MKNVRLVKKSDSKKVNALLNSTFGPGRFARSVYRLREQRPYEEHLSFVYEQKNNILACISYCKTILNNQFSGLLLGPLAVELKFKGQGFGVQLVEHTLELIMEENKDDFVIVVGDFDYYERFGFNKISQKVNFYGPVDKGKLLIKQLKKGLSFSNTDSIKFS